MSDNTNREPYNKLRVDLYRRLLPHIQEEDQASGAHGYVFHWDDPDAAWDALASQGNLSAVWDSIGLAPVVQDLFYVIETSVGEDLAALESLDALTNPITCPAAALSNLAASLGYRLSDNLTDDQKRAAVLGLVQALKSRGTTISFKVFYRLLGFDVSAVHPLYKFDINEANNDYSQTPYQTTHVASAAVGPSGLTTYSGALPFAPVVPGSVRFTDGTTTLRDDGEGNIIGPGEQTGTINYTSGTYSLIFTSATAGPVTASLDQITKTWQYPAARIDVDILLNPTGGPIPIIDAQVLGNILVRMEEVRPIHVLVRNLALVAVIPDVFGADGESGATDQAASTQIFKDIRSDRNNTDEVDAAPAGCDMMQVDFTNSGTLESMIVAEDMFTLAQTPDTLIITIIPNVGAPTSTFW